MRTCRAIRAECLAAFYGDLVVLYRAEWPSYSLRQWLKAIGPKNREHVAIYDFDSVLDRTEGAKFRFVRGSQYWERCVGMAEVDDSDGEDGSELESEDEDDF